MSDDDRLLHALDGLESALEDNVHRAAQMSARIRVIREERAAGASYTDIISRADPPLLVELLTESANALDSSGARVRRMEAHALHREGMTMEQIARLFGVTRQRVSALLRDVRLAQANA